MEEKKLILFNFNGVLLLTVDQRISLLCQVIREEGLEPDYKIICRNWEAPFQSIIDKLAIAAHWTEEQKIAVKLNCQKKCFKDSDIIMPVGIGEKLKDLKADGYEIGVITNQKRDRFNKALKLIGLDLKTFSFIKTGDDGLKKFGPEIIEKISKRFSLEKEVVFVGNRPDECPKGIRFIGITSYSYPKGLFEAKGIQEKFIYPSIIKMINALIKKKDRKNVP